MVNVIPAPIGALAWVQTTISVVGGDALYTSNRGRVRTALRYSGGSATMQPDDTNIVAKSSSDGRAKRETGANPSPRAGRRDSRVTGDGPSTRAQPRIASSKPRVAQAGRKLPSSLRVLRAEREREETSQRGRA